MPPMPALYIGLGLADLGLTVNFLGHYGVLSFFFKGHMVRCWRSRGGSSCRCVCSCRCPSAIEASFCFGGWLEPMGE